MLNHISISPVSFLQNNGLRMFRKFEGYECYHPCSLNCIKKCENRKNSNWGLDQFPSDREGKVLFKITRLLRYNSHTIKFKLFKCTIVWCIQSFISITTITFQNIFITPQKTPYPLAATLLSTLSPPGPWQPWIYFLCLWICCFWTFHINGTKKHVTFCVWLLALSIVFLRFIHVAICISILFLLIAK